MKELYWINVLGNLNIVCIILATLLCMIFVVGLIFFVNDEFDDEDQIKKALKYTLIGLMIFTIGSIFIPSKRDLYIIYGIGSTIDYVKENNTAQKLPDKTVECLDKFMDEYLNKKEDE